MNVSRGRDVAWTAGARHGSLVASLVVLGLAGLCSAPAAGAQDAAAVDPAHYKVAFENDQVRVLRITYGPHEKSVMHSHPAGVVVFLNDLSGRFTLPGGKTEALQVKAGTVQWAEASAHLPENLGDKPFEVIQIEMKAGVAGAADEAAIRASAPAWAAAFNAAEADKLAGMYWDDAVLLPPNVPAVAGGGPLREYFAKETPGFKAAGLKMNIPAAGAVHVAGDLAYESGDYRVTDASGTTVETGKYIGVFLKRNGKWRYIRDTWNMDAPPPPAAK